jgi:hypothetical protein
LKRVENIFLRYKPEEGDGKADVAHGAQLWLMCAVQHCGARMTGEFSNLFETVSIFSVAPKKEGTRDGKAEVVHGAQ